MIDAPHSPITEDYLKVVYELEQSGGRVGTKQLARRLGVSGSAVSLMVQQLANRNLLSHERYRGVTLTAEGRVIALRIVRRHRLVECLLVNLLGVPWDQVHEEAERWEHVLSDAVEARIEEVLGHPRADPHGAPIPARDGSLPYESQICLLDLAENQTGTIAEVSDDDPELLRYLQELGLIPGAAIHFLRRLPFGGPVMLRIGYRDCALGADAARHIYIEL